MFSNLVRHGYLAFCLVAGLVWQSSQAAGSLSVERAVSIALQDNPGLAEVQARAEAATHLPSQAGALPDPELSLTASNVPVDSFDLTQEPMTQFQVGISQKLPWPGKLGLSSQAAYLAALNKQDAVAEAQLMLAQDVRLSWWNLYYLNRVLETVEENQRQLRTFVQLAQVKYRVGEGSQQDVLLAQVELSDQLERSLSLQGMQRNEAARLHALLNHHDDPPLNLPLIESPQLTVLGAAAEWLRQAEEKRPLLSMKQHSLDAADRRLDLAQLGSYPDFTLRGAYGVRGGDNPDGSSRSDFLSLGIGFNLPIYQNSKQNREVDQRTSERLEARYALDDARLKVREQVERALADYEQGREQAGLLLNGIIPQTEQAMASMIAGYQVGQADIFALLRTQIKLNNYRSAYWKALSQAKQAKARLLAAAGGEMNHE